jgi:hypothetical protein
MIRVAATDLKVIRLRNGRRDIEVSLCEEREASCDWSERLG